MSSTFLTRLRIGEILVDAKGVSRLYRPSAGNGPDRGDCAGGAGRVRDRRGDLAEPRAAARPDLAQGPGPAGHSLAAMFDFRYHAISLVAVFLALAIGILLGVTIGDSLVSQADKGLRELAPRGRRLSARREQRAQVRARSARGADRRDRSHADRPAARRTSDRGGGRRAAARGVRGRRPVDGRPGRWLAGLGIDRYRSNQRLAPRDPRPSRPRT